MQIIDLGKINSSFITLSINVRFSEWASYFSLTERDFFAPRCNNYLLLQSILISRNEVMLLMQM